MSEPVILEREDWEEFVGKCNELIEENQKLREDLIKAINELSKRNSTLAERQAWAINHERVITNKTGE